MGHHQLDTQLLQPQVKRRWLGMLPHVLPPHSQPGLAAPSIHVWLWGRG